MTKEQFALWLQGYLQLNVYQWYTGNVGPHAFDVQKVADDVLEAARCVPTEAQVLEPGALVHYKDQQP
jgi:hypothetical protein